MTKVNYKNIERRIKEVAKDYENKGYTVSINPDDSSLPNFLKGFEPDIIAKNGDEVIVIEVKTREDVNDLKRYERFANEISERKGWRFELVFTNPQTSYVDTSSEETLNKERISKRLDEIIKLANIDSYEAAFLLGWSTIEGAIRLKLEKETVPSLNKPTSYIFKTLFSYGLINQSDYRLLDKLFLVRNSLVHGFNQKVSRADIDSIVSLIKYLIGDSIKYEMQEWLENLDLDYYEDIHSLYLAVYEKDSYGAFTCQDEEGKIIIRADYIDEELVLDSNEQRKLFAHLIEEEFMEGMDAESWYGFRRAMEKDD